MYDVLYIPGMHLFMHSECCCRCCCGCSVAILLSLPQLLLFVIVCRMAKLVASSLNLIPIGSLDSNTTYLTRYPFRSGTVSHLRPRFAYTSSSVFTGMRGAKAGISPPQRSPPCSSYNYTDFCASPGKLIPVLTLWLGLQRGKLMIKVQSTATATATMVGG